MKRYANYCTTRRAGGFNLMEVLVAMGLFALGFAAIASIFPAAAVLQRNTATDVKARSLKANAKAVISAVQLVEGDLTAFYPAAAIDVRPFPTSGTPALNDFWSLDTRSYPVATSNFVERDLYWVPLIRDTDPDPDPAATDWQLYVFILKRDRNTGEYTAQDYPKDDPNSPTEERIPGIKAAAISSVTSTQQINISSYIEVWPGDPVLDSDGKIYRIKTVTHPTGTSTEIEVDGQPNTATPPTSLWYAPPADRGNSSPAIDLFVLPITTTP